MPPQSRVGDNAHCPACSHGKNCCAHPVTGPGTVGSTNILINDSPPLRIGDPGVHSACCGGNSWVLSAGSQSVFFNGIPASRIGDSTTHCGGVGTLIQGSNNVLTGG
jgi:uncharacterized Zn-binding protein involved in type VI secretion